MNEKITIAIIGAGGIVQDAHLPAYQIANFQVESIFDLNTEKAAETAKKFQIPHVHSSLDELIEQSSGKTIFDVAVPGKAILSVLEKLPDQSVVLIQKPMGENLEQANQILKVCREKKLTAGINFQLRYAPFINKARELIDSTGIGEIHDIEINVNVFTPWHLWDFLYDLPRMEILYHSIHYIDLVRSFFGNPDKIYAKSIKHPDSKALAQVRTNIIMDYGDWKRANILTNHNHNFGEKNQQSYIKLEGTKGAIKISVGVLKNYPEGKEDSFEYFSENSEEWKTINIEGSWFPHAFIGSMQEMMKAKENPNYIPDNSVEDCIYTMACVEAAYESSESGGMKLNNFI